MKKPPSAPISIIRYTPSWNCVDMDVMCMPMGERWVFVKAVRRVAMERSWGEWGSETSSSKASGSWGSRRREGRKGREGLVRRKEEKMIYMIQYDTSDI